MAALRGYRGNSDWQVEEGLFAEMIALGFPSSLLVMGGLMVAGFVFQRFGTNLPSPSQHEMIACWFAFVAVGCIQWFLIVPYLFRRWRRKQVASLPHA
jgi:hypothetical protein